MSASLRRLARIRKLLEDLARLEFERNAVRVRQIENAAAQQRSLALASRARAVGSLQTQPQEPDWRIALADADLLAYRGGRLEAMAAGAQPGLDASREQMLARRVDRRQVESLMAARVMVEEKGRRRREQSQTDDWFQSRAARRRRRVK